MDSYWVEVPTQYMRIEEAVHSDGLATPPSDDYADFDAGGAAADSTVEELPEEFFKLTDAAIRGDLDLVKSIFESERLPNSPMERIDNNQFVPIMHKALVNGHVLVVVYFLSQGIPFNMVQIGIVVNYGLHSLLPIFLENGWNINEPLRHEQPPALTLTLDNRQLCEWFLSHGADPNAQCNYDITPLSHGVTYASREIIELLFQHGGLIEKGQLLHNAVHREKPDCLEIIQMLLNKGCDINAMKYKNHKHSYDYYKILQGLGTPLHDAAERGHPGVVKFLLANGADPLVRDTMNELPIDRAKRGRHTEVVDFLRHYSEPSA